MALLASGCSPSPEFGPCRAPISRTTVAFHGGICDAARLAAAAPHGRPAGVRPATGGHAVAATISTGERLDSSYRSLPVYWPVRWRLIWIARNDRRAGLPIGLDADTTPVLRDLLARRDDACEHERTRYYADIGAIDVRLADIARSRVLRLVEYADRLAAVYRRALLRRHPQREVLVTCWASTLGAFPTHGGGPAGG